MNRKEGTMKMKRTMILAAWLVFGLTGAALANSITQNWEAGITYVDHGATATADPPMDLTSKIVVTGSVNVMVPATYTVSYNVTATYSDSVPPFTVAADPATRTVIVADRTKPVITLKGPATITVLRNTPLTSIPGLGATAADSFAGVCPVTSVWVPAVDTAKAGVYTVTHNALDPSGNAAIPKTQTLIVVGKPIITVKP